MIPTLATALIIAALVLAAFGVVSTVRGRAPGLVLLAGAAALELALLAQVALAALMLAGGARPEQTGLFVAYLVGGLLLLPVAGLWAIAERTRWSSAVVAVAGLAFSVLIVRMQDLWASAGA